MVGIAVGMLGIVVMMQMYSLFENQKRSSTSGNDAQNSGAIAMHQLQRDIRHSGYGISTLDLLGCTVQLRAGPPAVTLTAIAPVTINPATAVVPAGDANTDTLLVVYGNSNGPIQGDGIQSGSGAVYTMENTPTALQNDYAIAEPLSLLDTLPRPACSLTLDRVAVANIVTTPANNDMTMTTGGISDGKLYNLGQSPVVRAYAIRNGSLTVCDYMVNDCGLAGNAGNPKIWLSIAGDIVSMRAQYGHDTNSSPMDGILDTYNATTPTTNCGWAKALAVRIALVARGAVSGGENSPAPTWAGGAINLAANANWQRYRYKVFETTVPIRNVAWMGVQTGC